MKTRRATNKNMKKIFKIITYSTITLIILFTIFSTAYAALPDYTVLAPLTPDTVKSCTTDTSGKQTCTTDLSKYLPGIFNLSIGLAAVLAFVMITFGGIMYMTSDAISGKSQGRKYVTDAIYGLLLVIGAWVILYTIDPKI